MNRLSALAAMAAAVPLGAQTLPGLENYSLPPGQSPSTPAPTPTPTTTPVPTVAPVPVPVPAQIVVPTATPTPVANPTARQSTAAPAPSGSTLPAARAAPTLTTQDPVPAPSTAPAATPVPSPAPRATSAPSPAARGAPPPQQEASNGQLLWWVAGLGAVAIAALAYIWGRRSARRDGADEDQIDADAASSPAASVPPTPALAPAGPRAVLGLALKPTRAGLNMLSATVAAELTVVNTGDATATDIRVALVLISAHAGQGAEIADHYARPIGRPAVPAFSLAPGETRVARIVVALPRADIRSLPAGNRPMFVPVVAANCRYTSGGAAAQAVQSFVVGIERDDAAKLAPFWLDLPAKMYDRVAARPNATTPAG